MRRSGTKRLRGVFDLLVLVFLACVATGCDGDVSAAKASDPASSAARKPAPPSPPVELVWPTPNTAYAEGRGLEAFIQPTVSGVVTSGLFGSVRSGGAQFHEGLDLFPLEHDRKGEATDAVGAAMAGVVRHVNTRAGGSSYGRYIVLEHPAQSPAVYTLYAHLAEVAHGISPGVEVKAGGHLGTMGGSAGGYTIPKDRAHLHFEIGVKMTESFAAWYKRRGFGSPNEQGLYNGMNLMGLDPLEFFARRQAGGLRSLDEVFRDLPAAVTLRIAHAGTPDYIRRYPSLANAGGAAEAAAITAGGGWEIDFSVTGVPVRWRRVGAGEFAGWKSGEVRILSADKALLAQNRARKLVQSRRGLDVPGDDLRTVLEQVFDWRGW
ncbi:MAG: M23 family metallopeptidase [Verrucomicrobia bacterium]|nr:MAG: M23 family metallopeptidase [Verrucomicrobiota bacterium]